MLDLDNPPLKNSVKQEHLPNQIFALNGFNPAQSDFTLKWTTLKRNFVQMYPISKDFQCFIPVPWMRSVLFKPCRCPKTCGHPHWAQSFRLSIMCRCFSLFQWTAKAYENTPPWLCDPKREIFWNAHCHNTKKCNLNFASTITN